MGFRSHELSLCQPLGEPKYRGRQSLPWPFELVMDTLCEFWSLEHSIFSCGIYVVSLGKMEIKAIFGPATSSFPHCGILMFLLPLLVCWKAFVRITETLRYGENPGACGGLRHCGQLRHRKGLSFDCQSLLSIEDLLTSYVGTFHIFFCTKCLVYVVWIEDLVFAWIWPKGAKASMKMRIFEKVYAHMGNEVPCPDSGTMTWVDSVRTLC